MNDNVISKSVSSLVSSCAHVDIRRRLNPYTYSCIYMYKDLHGPDECGRSCDASTFTATAAIVFGRCCYVIGAHNHLSLRIPHVLSCQATAVNYTTHLQTVHF